MHLDKLETVVNWFRKYGIANVSAVKTGMAGALRVTVPKLDMNIPFEESDDYDIEVCFKTINNLIDAANVFSVAESISELVKDSDKQ